MIGCKSERGTCQAYQRIKYLPAFLSSLLLAGKGKLEVIGIDISIVCKLTFRSQGRMRRFLDIYPKGFGETCHVEETNTVLGPASWIRLDGCFELRAKNDETF